MSFYDDHRFFVRTAVAFLTPALDGGGVGIAIATAGNLLAINAGLAHPSATPHRPLVVVDAHWALDRLLVDGELNEQAFRHLIGWLCPEGIPDGEVRIVGEMVAILWERGEVTAMTALEEMWRELAEHRGVAVLCPYPEGAFNAHQDARTVGRLRRFHSSEIRPAHYRHVPDLAAQQQLADALVDQATISAATPHGADERAEQRPLDQLLEYLEELRDADHIRTELVMMLAHDLNSPLATVAAYLKLLEDNWRQMAPADVSACLQDATATLSRIERLTADLQHAAQLDQDDITYDLRPTELTDLFERTIAQMRLVTGRDIRLSAPPTLPSVLVDTDRQTQILTNLLINAANYSTPATPIQVTITPFGPELLISVHNHGPRIDAEDHDFVFRPSTRLDHDVESAVPGTGMGLYISKTLVERQGGRIWIDPATRTGTTFSYTVPTTSSEPSRPMS